VWQIPDAVDTVVSPPDEGWRYHTKHVEQFPGKINCVTLHLVGYIIGYNKLIIVFRILAFHPSTSCILLLLLYVFYMWFLFYFVCFLFSMYLYCFVFCVLMLALELAFVVPISQHDNKHLLKWTKYFYYSILLLLSFSSSSSSFSPPLSTIIRTVTPSLDVHGSVHHNTNLIEMTKKMQLYRTIYHSIVPWLLNMFRMILSLIIRSF